MKLQSSDSGSITRYEYLPILLSKVMFRFRVIIILFSGSEQEKATEFWLQKGGDQLPEKVVGLCFSVFNVSGAKLITIPGMGHEFPHSLIPKLAEGILIAARLNKQ